MKIRVYGPSTICRPGIVDEDSFLEMPDNAVLKDVFKKLKVPFLLRKLSFCTVNGKREKTSKKLKDGDVVSFFSPIIGG